MGSYAQIRGVEQARIAGNPAAEANVVEVGAKANLEKDAIRVTLPLSAAADTQMRVVVWLDSPKNVRSEEIVCTVSGDGRSAALPWPKDPRIVREAIALRKMESNIAKVPPARLVDYYDPVLSAVLAPQTFFREFVFVFTCPVSGSQQIARIVWFVYVSTRLKLPLRRRSSWMQAR